MGDKGGKKDKSKHNKQATQKHDQKLKKIQNRQPRKVG